MVGVQGANLGTCILRNPQTKLISIATANGYLTKVLKGSVSCLRNYKLQHLTTNHYKIA